MNKKIKYGIAAGLLTLTIASPLVTDVKTDAATCKLDKSCTTLKVGKTCNLKLKNCKKNAVWKSSNKKVATVTKNGKVTAKKKGTATVSAKVNSKKYSCKVNVKKNCTTQSSESCTNQNKSITNPSINSLLNSISNVSTSSKPNDLTASSTVNSTVNNTSNDSSTNQGSVTENSAYNVLNSLRSTYKEGTTLTNEYYYYSPVFGNGYGCYGFAAKLSDTVFGTTKSYTTHNSFDKIKVADNIRIGNSHSVIVLTKDSNSITVVEGNYNSSIHWDRKITASSLASSGFTVYTRY